VPVREPVVIRYFYTRIVNKKLLKYLLPAVALIALTPWPVAFAFDAKGVSADNQPIQITAAEQGPQPSIIAYGNAIGSVNPTDLFNIDAANNRGDFTVTLYITNTDELIHTYKYLILEVRIYVEKSEGIWEEVRGTNDKALPETYITLRDAQVDFALSGLASYKIAVNGGSVNRNSTSPTESSASPKFYLAVD
jgi:hypothetical protein